MKYRTRPWNVRTNNVSQVFVRYEIGVEATNPSRRKDYRHFPLSYQLLSSPASVVLSHSWVVPSFERGARITLNNHRENEITLPTRFGGDEAIKTELTDCRENRFDMIMQTRTDDLEGNMSGKNLGTFKNLRNQGNFLGSE
jgi:hypothetical protein